MTINSEIRKVGPFIGNGTASAFPFTFKVFQASDLEVVRLEVSTNVETVLTLNSQYTVTLNVDQDSNPGGTVTLIGGALASGYTLTLTSDVPYLQPTDLTNLGGFYPDVINDALDRATIQIQQLGVDVNRSIKVAVSSDVNTELPVPNANDLLGWDSTGTSLTNVDPSTLATVVAYATAYADVFIGDGVTTSWTLTRPAGSLYNLDVSIQGVTQEPVRDYTMSGTTITFTTAPFDTHRVLVKYKEGLPNYEGDSQDVRYLPAGTGAVATTVQAKLRETVSVKDFGAVGDGVTDDAAAIQAAIDYVCGVGYGCVYFPAGQYKVTDTLTVNSSNVSIAGDGPGASFIFPYGDYGDVLHFTSGTAGTYLFRNSIRDIAFYTQSETTSGATVHLERCRLIHMTDVDISEHFGGLLIDSVVHGSFANVNLTADAAFTSYKSGSYLLKAVKNASGVTPSENAFVNCDWRGNNGNNYLDYAVLVQASDGMSFANVHFGFCKTAGLALIPQTNTQQLSGVWATNCSFDTIEQYGVWVNEPSTSYTGICGGHNLVGGSVYNCDIGIKWNTSTTSTVSSHISSMSIFTCDTHGIQISKGSYINLNGIDITQVNQSSTTGYGVDLASSNVTYVDISDLKVSKGTGNTPSAGINIVNGVTNIRMNGLSFRDCAIDIANLGTSNTNSSVTGMLSNNNIYNVVANSSGEIIFPWGYDTLFLQTTYNVGQVNNVSSYKGRKVTLIALGNVDVYDTNNLIIAGTWSATNGDTLNLVCDGSNWYELSRSNNA